MRRNERSVSETSDWQSTEPAPAETPRGRLRFHLLLAASLLGALLLVLLITTQGGEEPPGTQGAPYQTATACQGCHNATYTAWRQTEHAAAWNGLQGSGNAAPQCESCHTTGAGTPGGFVSNTTTPEMVNVQCEECHGPGSSHLSAPPDQRRVTILVNYSAELCGTCHQGEHHPFYNEWALSGHADALMNLRGSPAANDSCLQCHSADYLLEPESTRKPSIATAREGITCAVCHNPHGSPSPRNLRMPKAELCASCHSASPSDPLLHPQSAMRAGYGFPDVAVDQFMPTVNCDRCHMYAYNDPNRIPPVTTGHSFRQRPEACVTCHSTPPFVLTIEESAALVDRWQGETLELLSQAQYSVAQAEVALRRAPGLGFSVTTIGEAQAYFTAANDTKNFVTADGSMGAHNPDYAKNLLLRSRERSQQVLTMLTPGRIVGRVVDASGAGLGGIDIGMEGTVWTTTDSDGYFSFQFAQGTHSFILYRDNVEVGELSNVNVQRDLEADVGTVRVNLGGGVDPVFYGLGFLLVLVAVMAAYVVRQGRRLKRVTRQVRIEPKEEPKEEPAEEKPG